jgi:polyphosphate kinase 2 (PPK2 family)
VIPQLLAGQHLPERVLGPQIWEERLESIRDWERHLARNGTYVLKFFLHISPEEQARRLMARLEDPDRAWKFARSDIEQRAHWPAFMDAYDQAMLATDAPHAPWFCIPADSKAYARVAVATQVALALERMNPQAPPLDPALVADLDQLKRALRRGGPAGTGAVSGP